MKKMVLRFYDNFYIPYFLHLRNTVNAYALILDFFLFYNFLTISNLSKT